jgi:hypothetical protein
MDGPHASGQSPTLQKGSPIFNPLLSVHPHQFVVAYQQLDVSP